MEHDNEIIEFVVKFKKPVCFLLGIPETKCSDKDISIFVDYLVGHKKNEYVRTDGGGVDYLKAIRSIPRIKRSHIILEKIASYFDRARINKHAFSSDFDKAPPFSLEFKDALEAWRHQQLRANFKKLSLSVNRLNNAVASLINLISNEDSDPVAIRKSIREIKYSIQSCESNLKSGLAMSIAMDIHPQKIWKASTQLYLGRADKMSILFKRVDQHLSNREIRSNLGDYMIGRQRAWRDGWRVVFDNHRLNKNKRSEMSYDSRIA